MTAEEAFKLSEKKATEIAEENSKLFQSRIDRGLYQKLFFLVKDATERGHFTVEVHQDIFNHPEVIKNFSMDIKRLGYQAQPIKDKPKFILVGWAHQFEKMLNQEERQLTPKEYRG